MLFSCCCFSFQFKPMALLHCQTMPHVALLPATGMGHLMPFLRLAMALDGIGSEVTFVAFQPTVSSAEFFHLTVFFSAHPQIHRLEFPVFPLDGDAKAADPFYLHCESIKRSADQLLLLLSSVSPSLSSLIVDISLASTIVPLAKEVGFRSDILFTSSATMLTLFAHLPNHLMKKSRIDEVNILGMPVIAASMVPPALHDPKNLFRKQFIENGKALVLSDGILVNTFEGLEPEALSALNNGAVVQGLPPVAAVGPLPWLSCSCPSSNSALVTAWLDTQPAQSVIYVSFGSRAALSPAQLRELGLGLEKSGFPFLWAVKSKIVDRDEEKVAKEVVEEIVGDGFMERVKGRGLVVHWVDQEVIMGHGSIGGFISHGGWNSVIESITHGVRILAWPRGADQRVNADLVQRNGFGLWMREWGWDGDEGREVVVSAAEIASRARELMKDARVGDCTAHVKKEAERAAGRGGSSYKSLVGLVEEWKL